MSPRLLMGIDLGGGSVRCVLLDADSGAHVESALASRERASVILATQIPQPQVD